MTLIRIRAAVVGAAVAALTVGTWLSIRARESPAAADSTRLVSLYALDQTRGSGVLTLNAATLATVHDSQPMSFGSDVAGPHDRRILASADGSTVLSLSARPNEEGPPTAADIIVQVFDVASRSLRATFHPAAAIDIATAAISPSGQQLLGSTIAEGGSGTSWYILNVANGQVVHTLSLSGGCCGPSQIDWQRQRLYVMSAPVGLTDPITPILTAYDLISGRKVGELTLRGVLIGQWTTGKQLHGNPVMGLWQPGMALSPAGRQMAVVAADTGMLRLIDTASMRVTRAVSLAREGSVLERIGGWLGLLPSPVSAKEIEGVDLQVSYSSDGTLLYPSGARGQPGTDGSLHWQGLGVRIVEVATGHVLAERLGPEQVVWLQAAPGGLYTLSLQSSMSAMKGCPCILRRLDPSGGQTVAERSFSTPPEMAVSTSHSG